MPGPTIDDDLRAELNRLVPAMPPDAAWPEIQERASRAAPAVACDGTHVASGGEVDRAEATSTGARAKTRPIEGRLIPQGARRRSALALAAISLVVVVLVAGVGIGVFEALTHLGNRGSIIYITDDTTLTSTPGQTAQTTAGSIGDGEWQPVTVTLGGAPVRSVAVDSSDSSVLYAATQQGLYKSTDAAASWVRLFEEVTNAVAVDPASPSTIIYAETEDWPQRPAWSGSTFLLRSDDGGASWQVLDDTSAAAERARAVLGAEPGASSAAPYPGGVEGPVVAAETGNPPALYVPTRSGVYKSTDAGATWSQANHGLGNAGAQTVQSVVIDPSDRSTIYVTTEAGIGKSTDGGVTWSKVHEDTGSQLILAPSAPSVLYAWTSDGLFRSGDGGLTWDRRACAGLASTGEYQLAFVAMNAPDTLYVYDCFGQAENSLLRSTDGGDTWKPCQTGGATVLHSLVYAPSEPSIYYASSTFLPYQPSESPGLLVSRDAGASWTYRAAPGNVLGIAVDAESPTVLYILCGELGGYAADYAVGGTLYQSVDAGSTWQRVAVDLPGEIQWVVSDPGVPGMLYALSTSSSNFGTGGRFYRSEDEGATWEDMSAGLEYDPLTGNVTSAEIWGFANDLVADPVSGTALYALTRSWTTSGLPINHLFKWMPRK